jgi:ribonuclease HII
MLQSRYKSDSVIEAGIDEAGRGCFWGPLFAAAVVWPEEGAWSDSLRKLSGMIKDSKRVAPKKRAMLEKEIKVNAIAWSIGRVEPDEIDLLGMTASNQLAFRRAVAGLAVKPGRLLIDGCISFDEHIWKDMVVEPKADNMYLAVAAASILAKEGRDGWVREQAEADSTLESQWHILSSKGYGTANHSAGIKKYGLHPLHRRLFLRNLLGADIHTRAVPCLIQDDEL